MKPTLRQIFKATNAVYSRLSTDYPYGGLGGFPNESKRARDEYGFYKATYIVLGWHYEYDNKEMLRYVLADRIGSNASLFIRLTCNPKNAEIVKEIRKELYEILID
jgi:hypothetical protein